MTIPENIAQLISLVNDSEIASIGRSLQFIVQLINDPNSTTRQLTAALEMDPPLTAKILKISNSAYYSARTPIDGIEKATVWLGYNTVREIALSQKASDFFQKSDKIGDYSRDTLWMQSLISAMLNKAIHRQEYGIRGDNAYVTGILHQLGILVFDQFKHEAFKEIVHDSMKEKQNFIVFEERYLGFNHPEFCALLLESWGIPQEVCEPIRYHHTPFNSPESFRKSSISLYLANSIHALNNGEFTDTPDFNEKLFEQALDKAKINFRALEILYNSVLEEIRKMEVSDCPENG